MENNLQIFESNDFGQLRTIDDNGKVMFVASDVAKMLGYTKPANAISTHCRYTLKRGIPHPQGKGTLEVNIIPEGDLYRLITHSKLPAAEKLKAGCLMKCSQQYASTETIPHQSRRTNQSQ